MSLVIWLPAGEDGFRGFPIEPEELFGMEFVSHWFGEDRYQPGCHFWLQLFKGENSRTARLRGFRKAELLTVPEELVEDACGFLRFDSWDTHRLADDGGKGVDIFEIR